MASKPRHSTKGARTRNVRIPSTVDPPDGKTLSVDEALFVIYFLQGIGKDGEAKRALNATAAARKLGYADPEQRGSDMLRKPGVRAAIAARINQAAMSADEVLARQTEIARGSMEDFFSRDARGGWRLDLDKAKRLGKMHLIRKLEFTKFGPKVELYDAMEAQRNLLRVHGLEQNNVNVFHKVDLTQLPNNDAANRLLARIASGAYDDPEELYREYRELIHNPTVVINQDVDPTETKV